MIHIIATEYEVGLYGAVANCEEADVQQAISDVRQAEAESDSDNHAAQTALGINTGEYLTTAGMVYLLLVKRGATEVQVQIHSV